MDKAFLDNRFSSFLSHTVESLARIPHSPGFDEACDCIYWCRGKLVTTGMGKAYHAAAKAASSFSSLGTPSVSLHPGEAAHGDIGVIGGEDVLMAFSTSGKTREVLETIAFSRHLGVKKVIAVTSHPDAGIRVVSDIVVDMGEVKEAGHLSMAPTTSILAMLTLADMMAVMVAEFRGFVLEDYADRHHGGYLGAVARGDGVIR